LIFIYGIPRSGTTVLQRLLASGDNVSTQDETWLIPRLVSNSINRFASPSNYRTAINASNNFVKDLDKLLFDFACDLLVRNSTNKSRVLVEKTPRNYLYLDLISESGETYVGIVRRPTDILNSFFKEFFSSTFRGMIDYEIDIVLAPNIMALEKLKNRSLIVKYEDLQDASSIKALENHTKIKLNPAKLKILDGTIGDKNIDLELKVRSGGELNSIDTYVKKIFTKFAIKRYFPRYCSEFDYPMAHELGRLNRTDISWCLARNLRDLLWISIFIIQKTLYSLYRYSRKTTNLSKDYSCS